MSVEKLKSARPDGKPEIVTHGERLGASAVDINTIIAIVQKFGHAAQDILAVVLPFVPPGQLATILALVETLLGKLNPTQAP